MDMIVGARERAWLMVLECIDRTAGVPGVRFEDFASDLVDVLVRELPLTHPLRAPRVVG